MGSFFIFHVLRSFYLTSRQYVKLLLRVEYHRLWQQPLIITDLLLVKHDMHPWSQLFRNHIPTTRVLFLCFFLITTTDCTAVSLCDEWAVAVAFQVRGIYLAIDFPFHMLIKLAYAHLFHTERPIDFVLTTAITCLIICIFTTYSFLYRLAEGAKAVWVSGVCQQFFIHLFC